MSLASFFDGIIDAVIPAVVKTAGEFVIGGPSGQQQPERQQQLQEKVGGFITTKRVSRPNVPGTPEVADVATLVAEWKARMNAFSALASVTDSGKPRTLGTQARRS